MKTQQQTDAESWVSAQLAWDEAQDKANHAQVIADEKYDQLKALGEAIRARAAVDVKQPTKFYKVSFLNQPEYVVRVSYNPIGAHSFSLNVLESET